VHPARPELRDERPDLLLDAIDPIEPPLQVHRRRQVLVKERDHPLVEREADRTEPVRERDRIRRLPRSDVAENQMNASHITDGTCCFRARKSTDPELSTSARQLVPG